VCDDIQLRVEDNRIVEAANACTLGAEWFGDGRVPSGALVRGRQASVDEALKAGADALRDASRVLVFLAPDISCEAQRAAIAVADRLRAAIDSMTSSTTKASLLAAQEAGRASATLGEIRNRADVVVFWGVDPARRYPRFWTRYAPESAGLFVGGRTDRTVVAVDVGGRHGPADADTRVALVPDREVSTVMEWTAAIAGPPAARQPGGAPILDTLLRGKYVAIVVDAEPDEGTDARDNGRTAALLAFAQALNGPTRCALMSLRAGGNRSGADACLTAQTGYPMAVDFSCGYPRYRPHDDGGVRVSRGAVDAVLIVGSAVSVPPELIDGRLPTVVVAPRATEQAPNAAVSIDTGVVGIHESGTALRMDDVALPLVGTIAGPPSTLDVVAALAARL
jgi:formylmethanofuran dehydrogenase subunit B